jgi:hypothetical protein
VSRDGRRLLASIYRSARDRAELPDELEAPPPAGLSELELVAAYGGLIRETESPRDSAADGRAAALRRSVRDVLGSADDPAPTPAPAMIRRVAR